jgi:acetylornithine deacetylase/succinyl-diaminopimelate desuccinylase-like protein
MGQAQSGISSYLEAHRTQHLAELCEYLAIPSISALDTGMEEAAAWVGRRLKAVGARVQEFDPEGGKPILFAELGPADAERCLLIYNHYDVQPVDPLELWTSPPFEPALREGKLYARGTADNKANFLARVQAVEAWQTVHGALPLRIRWIIEGEEETGSRSLPGFCEAEGHRWADSDGCLWEAGYKDEQGRMRIYSGLKGLASFELQARAGNGDKHSSNATLLPNAAWRLTWALASLKDADENILIEGLMDQVRPPSASEVEYLRAIPFDSEEFGRTNGVDRLLKGVTGAEALIRHLYQPTCTICGIGGGYQDRGMKTVLPHRAMAKLSFRLVPDLEPELVGRLLRAHLDAKGFEDIEVIALAGEHPAPGYVDSAVVQAARASVETVSGIPPVVWPHMAATGPMHPVTARFGIPAVGFGTGYWGSANHAPDENIRMDDYYEGIAIAADFFGRFAGLAINPTNPGA